MKSGDQGGTAKRGRPPLDLSDRRVHSVEVRMTKAERDETHRLAKLRGVSVSEMIRAMLAVEWAKLNGEGEE